MKRFFRNILWIIIIATVVTLAVNVTRYLINRQSQLAQLLRQRAELRAVIQRLTGRTRRAELLVDGQVLSGTGKVLRTTLLWREFTIGPDGKQVALPMRKIVIPGDMPYVDGYILNFQKKYVEDGDMLRGKSLAFFHRIYADSQAPDRGTSLLGPHDVPLVLSNKYGHPNALERQLWNHITVLLEHPRQCPKFGLDLVQVQAVARPVRPGRLYEIDLQNAGGLEFRAKPGGSALVRKLLQQANTAKSQVQRVQ